MDDEGRTRSPEPRPWVPTCACGKNLDIWKNPWNHQSWCDRQPVNTPARVLSETTAITSAD